MSLSFTPQLKLIADNEPVYTLTPSKIVKYICLVIDYDDPSLFCLYTFRNRISKEILRLPVTLIYQKADLLDGFSTLDIQRICTDYAWVVEMKTRKMLETKRQWLKLDEDKCGINTSKDN